MAYGIDTSTVFFLRGDDYVDLSNNNRAITNYSSKLVSNGKFGSSINMANSRITCANATAEIDWSKDVTIEWWEYMTISAAASGIGGIFYNRIATGTGFYGVLIGWGSDKLYTGNTSTAWNGYNQMVAKNVTANEWVHWAFVKQGTSWKSFRNGVLYWSGTNTIVPSACDKGLTIGAWYDANITANYPGQICEYRISNIARYTSNFEVQTRPYTSIDIRGLEISENYFNFELSKTPGEITGRIEILCNDTVVTTMNWSSTLSIDKSYFNLSEGVNNVKIKVNYANNYYEERNFKVSKDAKVLKAEPSDGIDKNTIFCLRGDTYTDLSENPKKIVTTGTALATNGQFGLKGINTNTGYMSIANCFKNFDWAGDFTIEWWEYPNGSFSKGALFFNRASTSSANTQHGLLMGYHGTMIYMSNASVWANGFSGVTNKSVTLNTWTHWAFVRQGSTWKSYKNGTLFWTGTNTITPNACDNGLTIGAWIETATFDYGYNAIINDYRISNIARYTDNFTPRQAPFSSIGISDIVYSGNKIECVLSKNTNESFDKIEVIINGNVKKTYTSWTYDVDCDIDTILYGDNTIEVKVYYCNNYSVSKKIIISKEFETKVPKLPNNASFNEAIIQTTAANSLIKEASDALVQILNAKGVPAGENSKLTQLVCLVSKISNSDNDNVSEYISQISELTTQVNSLTVEAADNKLALVNALVAKNIECSIDEEYSSLINKINLFEEVVELYYLYKSGNTYDNITGGYVTKYSFTSASAIYNTSDILIKANAGSSGGASVISTKSMIDVTKYKYLKARININSASTNGGFMLYVKKTFGTYPWNDNIAVSDKYKTLGAATITLDISTLSGSHYIALGIDAGSSGSATMSATVYELWLE